MDGIYPVCTWKKRNHDPSMNLHLSWKKGQATCSFGCTRKLGTWREASIFVMKSRRFWNPKFAKASGTHRPRTHTHTHTTSRLAREKGAAFPPSRRKFDTSIRASKFWGAKFTEISPRPTENSKASIRATFKLSIQASNLLGEKLTEFPPSPNRRFKNIYPAAQFFLEKIGQHFPFSRQELDKLIRASNSSRRTDSIFPFSLHKLGSFDQGMQCYWESG